MAWSRMRAEITGPTAEAMTFSGFGTYEFGSGTWTLTVTIGSDKHGGTNITLLTASMVPPPAGASPAPSTQAMVAAMAGLGAVAGSVVVAGVHIEPLAPTLLTRD